MKNVNSYLILILSIMLFCACGDNDREKIMTLKVGPYKVKYEPPFGEADIMGYAVTDSENREYVIPYIHDFEDKYEEGYEYVIKVRAVEKGDSKNPIQDEFGYTYYLLEIISKDKKE